MENKFVIKINKDSQGNELSLDNMPIEAVVSLYSFLESLSSFGKLQTNSEEVRISLKHGSIQTEMVYPDTRDEITDIINSVVEGTSSNNEYIKLFKDIQDPIKANGLDYSVFHYVDNVEKNLTPIFKGRKFPLKRGSRNTWTTHVKFMNGNLFNAGGKVNTNIHIDLPEEPVKIDCSKDQAKKINTRLYDEVYLSVLVSSKLGRNKKYKLVDSYLKEENFTSYSNFYNQVTSDHTLDKYDLIHDFLIGIIDDSDRDDLEVLKIMRLFNFGDTDRGVLRTILMTLKPIRSQHEKLHEMYNELAEKLRLTSSNNII